MFGISFSSTAMALVLCLFLFIHLVLLATVLNLAEAQQFNAALQPVHALNMRKLQGKDNLKLHCKNDDVALACTL